MIDEPQTPQQKAVDEALDLLAELLGGEPVAGLIGHIDGKGFGGFLNIEDPGEIFAFLLNATIGIGKQLGVEVAVVDPSQN
jgi:hypothetical protein